MPSLLSPTSSSAAKAYAPLADEVNPPFGNAAPAPLVTRNGTIVYGKRPSSASSSHSSEDNAARFNTYHHTESEETLSPSASQKGKGRGLNGYAQPAFTQGEADLGELRRGGGTIRAKGKERAWDEEMGDKVEALQPEAENGSYPPMNEEEEEERRIQDHLARMAARDMARRRAARVSRQLSSTAPPTSPTSTSTTSSFMRRPFSMMSTISSPAGKRNSIMGLMEGILGSPKAKEGRWTDGELPMSSSPQAARPSTQYYNNPYEPHNDHDPTPIITASPTSPSRPSPFGDAHSTSAVGKPGDFNTRRTSLGSTSSNTTPPLHSPTEDEGFTYGYAGASWRGGAAAVSQAEQANIPQGGDKWWHALCAWGSDLDGGHDAVDDGNQGARTNPFE